MDSIVSVQNKNFTGNGEESARPVKNYPGIIVRQHLIVLRQMVLLKDGTSSVLLRSSLDEKLCADSMQCCCYLRDVQDLLSDGRTLYERRLANHS